VAGQQQVVSVAILEHLAGRSLLQEGGKDQRHTILYLVVRVLGHPAQRIADQADGQGQRQLAPLGLIEEAGS
jgi:hypothetical protein